ncbi:MAG: FmdB family transcriptional regulator [Actinomycetota bacterium]|nr:FmdB family transcriptional regulator [Actinomycetota bacterium]
MPTYQYACTNAACANRFELVQSFTDPSVSACPLCAGAVRKVYGSVGVVFKGSGFYRNDSRNTVSDSDAKADSKPDGKAESTSNGKPSDGKPVSSSDAKSSEPKTSDSASKPSSSSKAAAAT